MSASIRIYGQILCSSRATILHPAGAVALWSYKISYLAYCLGIYTKGILDVFGEKIRHFYSSFLEAFFS